MTRQRLMRVGMMAGLLLLAPTPSRAQRPQRPRSPNDALVSPEVQNDHRVTFRIYAPKATEVIVRGDFGPEAKLTKDAQGVWSVTVGPLAPDFYSYNFYVDGVKTADSKNALIKPGISSVDSMVFVRGNEADFEDNKDVPHGEVRKVWYRSTTLNAQRRMHVYTPPGYDDGNERYPVFYLLHGSGDEDSGWSTIGRAGFILDNLIAQKKAKPMLIVMPNGSLPRPANFRRPPAGAPRDAEFVRRMAEFQGRFVKELLQDIVPQVEKRFRVRSGAENRALAGLSMGGGQTLAVVTTHPDQFGYVGVWSGAIFGSAEDYEKSHATFFESADKVNKTVKMFSISCGDQDRLLNGSKSMDELLKKHGIKHALHISGGGHTWINWRHYLNDFAPQLFQ
jgi:enterochelin esterase-like enzyme